MPSADDAFPAMSEALAARYGRPELFAPGDDPFEAIVAALLDRALDPPKRARAVDALRDAGLLDPQVLAGAEPSEAAEAIRSAGLKVQDKALGPLRRVARWLVELHHGDTAALADPDGPVSTEQLREELATL